MMIKNESDLTNDIITCQLDAEDAETHMQTDKEEHNSKKLLIYSKLFIARIPR